MFKILLLVLTNEYTLSELKLRSTAPNTDRQLLVITNAFTKLISPRNQFFPNHAHNSPTTVCNKNSVAHVQVEIIKTGKKKFSGSFFGMISHTHTQKIIK